MLRRLIRFDTTNPPGNERPCLEFLRDLLRDEGLDPRLLGLVEERPNLIVRVAGRQAAPPILWYGHVDVVPAQDAGWTHPAFAGELADGCVWGRGALDMKSGVAMMIAALTRFLRDGHRPAGDLILAIVADEETGGFHGAQFLVDRYPDLFSGVRFALGEFGAFSIHVGAQKFFPIQVLEKEVFRIRASTRGPAGHGAIPQAGTALARMAAILTTLDRQRLPIRLCDASRIMIDAMSRAVPWPRRAVLRMLLQPRRADLALRLLGRGRPLFEPLVRNTVSVTRIQAGDGRNVVPAEAHADLDVRVVPGCPEDELIDELRALLGPEVALDVTKRPVRLPAPDLGMFATLAAILKRLDPEGTPVPMLLPGATDARHFSALGIQTYGFVPLDLPRGISFMRTIHAADERVPVAALDFGTEALLQFLHRYGEAS